MADGKRKIVQSLHQWCLPILPMILRDLWLEHAELFNYADGAMTIPVWNKDQKAVSAFMLAINTEVQR